MRSLRSAGSWLALVLALGALALPVAATGCFGSCEDDCLDQYDDCVERAPPGASKADCSEQYQRCLDTCAAL